MNINESSPSSSVNSELYFLITKFLEGGPCQQAAEALKQELARHNILPKRLDWIGNEHNQNFQELERKYSHIGPQHLLEICQRIGPILDKEIPPSVPGVKSLLGAGRQSLLRTPQAIQKKFSSRDYILRKNGFPPKEPFGSSTTHNIVRVLMGREHSGPLRRQQAVPPHFFAKQQLHRRLLGHLSAVYCLLFDRTGRYVFTGADDLLVKIWSAIDGRLLATLRGATAEITDIAVNPENTLLAAGSLDKIIRVWCLQTCAPVAILCSHTGMITSVNFCPMPQFSIRYLVSTSTDGSIAFWSYQRSQDGFMFHPKPLQYNERMRPGQAQMHCASFSPGGVFLAAGSADHHVRVYLMLGEDGPHRILETEVHSDTVDSIQWANRSLQFISGSKCGTAHIWRFERQQWRSIELVMSTKLTGEVSPEAETKANKLRVSMVCWDLNDERVITAVNDGSLKVWCSQLGTLLHVLKGHKDDVFVLEHHPHDPTILLSASHDGQIYLWDIVRGQAISSYQNLIEGQGHGGVYDAKWSPTGLQFSAVDSHGHILMFGFGQANDRMKNLPTELFFHTDYRPLIRDAQHYVYDEQTQTPPHLMPPPFLVDVDGNPYPPALQRLVPGRERCQGEQLVPNILVNAGGQQEIIQGVLGARSNIDQMIQQLANRGTNEGGPQLIFRHINSPRAGGPRGLRRDGDVEGVRQSSGNWQREGVDEFVKRTIIPPLDVQTLKTFNTKISTFGKQELERYRQELRRRPIEPPPQVPTTTSRAQNNRRRYRNPPAPRHYRTRAAREQENEGTDNTSESSGATAPVEDAPSSTDVEEADLDSSSSSSSDSSSEYSDWVADAGVNLEPPKRSKRRPPPKPPRSISSPEPQPSTSTLSAPEPSTSTNTRSSNRSRKKIIRDIIELPEIYRPSEWLSEVIPRKAPYYPQMGDEIVYFRQGHDLYLKTVREKNVYDTGPRSEPWSKHTLREHEVVKVIGIKYEIRPPRLCCLKLAMLENGRLTGDNFTIKYHDMADVLDFLVLKQTYDTALARNWDSGDGFRCMIDDSWWIGQIEAQDPYDPDFPDSLFLCYRVRWDNGEYERMSPWDLEPINNDRLPPEIGGAVPVLPAEIQGILYQPQPEEWPSGDRDATCIRILSGLDQIMSISVAEPFIAPVDLSLYPSYALVVEYPIDLSTIKGRFENRFYRRVTSAQFDVRYIATNAEKFNESGSLIVKQARIVTELCLKIIKESQHFDIPAFYHQLLSGYRSSSESEQDNEDDGSEADVTGSSLNNRLPRNGVATRRQPRRCRATRFNSTTSTVNSNTSDRSYDWHSECVQLIETLVACEDSMPFRDPVDPNEHPDYFLLIETPMDLHTAKEELTNGNYPSPSDFCKDMRLIFANSKNYNTNKRSRIYSMTIRLSAMFEELMRGILNSWKSFQRRAANDATRGMLRRTRRHVNVRRTTRPLRNAGLGEPSTSTASTSHMEPTPGPSSSSMTSRYISISHDRDDDSDSAYDIPSTSSKSIGKVLTNGNTRSTQMNRSDSTSSRSSTPSSSNEDINSRISPGNNKKRSRVSDSEDSPYSPSTSRRKPPSKRIKASTQAQAETRTRKMQPRAASHRRYRNSPQESEDDSTEVRQTRSSSHRQSNTDNEDEEDNDNEDEEEEEEAEEYQLRTKQRPLRNARQKSRLPSDHDDEDDDDDDDNDDDDDDDYEVRPSKRPQRNNTKSRSRYVQEEEEFEKRSSRRRKVKQDSSDDDESPEEQISSRQRTTKYNSDIEEQEEEDSPLNSRRFTRNSTRMLSEDDESRTPPGISNLHQNGSARISVSARGRIRKHVQMQDYASDISENGSDEESRINQSGRGLRPRKSNPVDDSSEESDHLQTVTSISSRGRVRKLTARARALLKD